MRAGSSIVNVDGAHRRDKMTIWAEKLRLKEMAEEDIYFARRDRELINAMRKRRSERQHPADKGPKQKAAKF